MPEKLISPSKSLLVNVVHKENEDGTLFDMDLEPVENRNPSHEATYPTKESSPSKKDKIPQESINHTQKSPTETDLDTDNDQISAHKSEPISKHVLRLVTNQFKN